jgi:hypothetical protein
MKRILVLTLIFSISLSYPVYAKPQYSPETLRLMQEAGIEYNTPVNEVMNRQEALKSGKGNKTTSVNKKTRKTAKTDEYKVYGKQSVKVTDTSDGLHIYNNDYNSPSNYGAKYSTDEFRVYGQDSPANDGYGEGGFDELHINENYRQNVWKPDHKILRLGIDQFKLPNEL